MIKHKRIGIVAALLMSAAVVFIAIAYATPSVFAAVRADVNLPYAAAMDKTKVLDIQIVADEKLWQEMLDNATAEQYIAATVIINGERIDNVGIRPKGNSSLSQVARDDTTDRYSFKIEFDKYIEGQTWLGLDKLAINNMQGDSTYMKEYLSYDIMDYAGVDAPLYAFSSITVNSEAWGFYLAIEALEDSFAQRVYGLDHGKLYKPESMGARGNGRMQEFINEIDEKPDASEPDASEPDAGGERAERFGGGFGGGFGNDSGGITLKYTDDDISSYYTIFDNAAFDAGANDYKRVISALKKLNAGENLEEAVDVEATLKYFAAHTFVVNLDSYVSNMCHNYYLYEKDGQLTMLPWDYNLSFGGFQSGNASSIVNFPIDTPVSGVSLDQRPMIGKLFEVPEYLALYHEYLNEIVTGYFESGLFERTISSLEALISPYVEADPSAFYDYGAFESGVDELKKLCLLRAQSIAGQLNKSIPSTSDGQSANPSALIDASSLNTSVLGSMGGGMLGGDMRGGDMQGIDMEKMRAAMDIIAATGEGEFPEDQLVELGLTQSEIAQLQSPAAFGIRGRQGNRGIGGPPQMDRPASGGALQTAQSGYDGATWITLGASLALILIGLAFVILFRRRRGL